MSVNVLNIKPLILLNLYAHYLESLICLGVSQVNSFFVGGGLRFFSSIGAASGQVKTSACQDAATSSQADLDEQTLAEKKID